MNLHTIPVISVSYNSADLIEDLLRSFRTYYDNPVTIIDGSSNEHYEAVQAVCNRYENVTFIHFDYNIHHGPGIAWAFQNLDIIGPVLVLDSDLVILKSGFLESMLNELEPEMYGVGYVNHVNEGGFDVDYENGAIKYLHPACMLCNIEVVRAWPMPTKHGAPMTEPMLALHRADKQNLIHGIDWVKDDFLGKGETRHYLRHDWQGTVKRTGSYNLEEWSEASKQEALVRNMIVSLIPNGGKKYVEIGSNSGALARVCKEANSSCNYTSVEIDPGKWNIVKGVCDQVVNCDIDTLGDVLFCEHASADCWILDRCLEHMKDPGLLLTRIRKVIGGDSCVVAAIPNAQHWSIQAKLCVGGGRWYADSGLLLDCNQLWLTRATMVELFQKTGFKVVSGYSVTHKKLENQLLSEAIMKLATSVGADPNQALQDAQPVQYIFKVVPV
ncbi:MAG: methyltransferase domain-containing protein [Desulfuromonadaceae bacterium]